MLAERLAGVLGVIYLVFNEGYVATEGPTLIRPDLCQEAIRLARLLSTLMPQEPEVRAMLALLLLTDARRAARTDSAGEPVLLPDRPDPLGPVPDSRRSRRAGSSRAPPSGRSVLPPSRDRRRARRCRTRREHQLAEDRQALDALVRLTPSPVAQLNRLVAVSMAVGPETAYRELGALDQALGDYPYYHAARADLLRRLDRHADARSAYGRALELATNPQQRAALARAATELY